MSPLLSSLNTATVADTLFFLALFAFAALLVHLLITRNIFLIEMFFLALYFVIPIFVTSLTASDPRNIHAVGHLAYAAILNHLPIAVSVSCLGLLSFVIFRLIFGWLLPPRLPCGTAAQALQRVWGTAGGLSLLALTLTALGFSLLLSDIELVPFQLRHTALINPEYRPLYLVAEQLSSLGVLLSVSKSLTYRQIHAFPFAAFFIACALFSGTRSSIIMPIFLGVLISLPTAFSFRGFLRALLVVPVLVAGALQIEWLRSRHNEPFFVDFDLVDRLLYGNNLSDMRDFAWILSGWDGTFFHGNTLLAGVLSLLPAAWSDFRTEWGWGRVTLRLTGLSEYTIASHSHAGLRPLIFGEWFMNFGLPGIIVLGAFFGFVFALAATILRRTQSERGCAVIWPRMVAVLLLSSAYHVGISSGMFTLYFYAGVTSSAMVLVALLPRGASVGASARPRKVSLCDEAPSISAPREGPHAGSSPSVPCGIGSLSPT